jgi:catechol 2,3-dioxygenase-like lactoylglutathione lyase family enzyme
MAYHHLALATRDIAAIHAFYEGVMGFELVKVEVTRVNAGGWAKHYFYRMSGDDSCFIAFWEMYGVPGSEGFETSLSKAAGLPDEINHIAFRVNSLAELDERRAQWTASGRSVLEVDHNWCRSIYTKDPNDNLVEFCVTTGAFTPADRARAIAALSETEAHYSQGPADIKIHEAATVD